MSRKCQITFQVIRHDVLNSVCLNEAENKARRKIYDAEMATKLQSFTYIDARLCVYSHKRGHKEKKAKYCLRMIFYWKSCAA